MAYKTLSARFPLRKLHRKEAFKKMQSAAAGARQAGRGEKGISRRGK